MQNADTSQCAGAALMRAIKERNFPTDPIELRGDDG
jgi:hypothetical protein